MNFLSLEELINFLLMKDLLKIFRLKTTVKDFLQRCLHIEGDFHLRETFESTYLYRSPPKVLFLLNSCWMFSVGRIPSRGFLSIENFLKNYSPLEIFWRSSASISFDDYRTAFEKSTFNGIPFSINNHWKKIFKIWICPRSLNGFPSVEDFLSRIFNSRRIGIFCK